MEELKGSSEVVSSIFTSNLGVLSRVLTYYNYAHVSAYLMLTLWTGSRRLFFKNNFEFILKDNKKCIKLKIEDTKMLKLIEKVNKYYTFDILITENYDELANHVLKLTNMQFYFDLNIRWITISNFISMVKVIPEIKDLKGCKIKFEK